MKAKCIMIQGTASSVGKSLITAGLCRIFSQDGFKTAPFKSQNMALNSYITRDGREMGRAQVVQAEAAGVEPHVDMNPILIKPVTDTKAQIIINGTAYGNLTASEYQMMKTGLSGLIRDTYERLAEKYDIIVIEGAGSPAEINLRENDFVNMGMAEIADAPVILVGDIDKGGVFAALAGTMLLLTEEERKRVMGTVINKFRGDYEILRPGIRMLEDIIKVPVFGVLPYMGLNIDDEDGFLARKYENGGHTLENDIVIIVIKLPHMSNDTDFNALEAIQGVKVIYADRVGDIASPDMLILPGTKNTVGDLLFIRETGIEEVVKHLNRNGTPLLGICGGFQMLGLEITDPYKAESDIGMLKGMSLLNTRTVFREEKDTLQVKARLSKGLGVMEGLEGTEIEGYEIHMGATELLDGCVPFSAITAEAGKEVDRPEGAANAGGTVFGTYIHGFFDKHEVAEGIVNNLRQKKGLPVLNLNMPDYKEQKEREYDSLADALRQHIDIKAIYEIINGSIHVQNECQDEVGIWER